MPNDQNMSQNAPMSMYLTRCERRNDYYKTSLDLRRLVSVVSSKYEDRADLSPFLESANIFITLCVY